MLLNVVNYVEAAARSNRERERERERVGRTDINVDINFLINRPTMRFPVTSRNVGTYMCVCIKAIIF